MKISLVVNTYNEEKNLERCLKSAKDLADEIVIVDMKSTDKTVEIAKKFGAKVYEHEYTRFVEPARTFALSKAKGDWILLLDADEILSETLAKKLKKIALEGAVDYVEMPRKNIIFGKWIKNSRWWPDYLPRFFKNGKVKIPDKIHSPYLKEGVGIVLEAEEENAIIHFNYQSIFQYLERMNRYTDIQSEELIKKNYKFSLKDFILKPTGEFLSRFFAAEGYKDGLHGLSLASLQAFSEMVVYLKVWEKEGFQEMEADLREVSLKAINDYLFWLQKLALNSLDRLRLKIKAKI